MDKPMFATNAKLAFLNHNGAKPEGFADLEHFYFIDARRVRKGFKRPIEILVAERDCRAEPSHAP
jgi:hypothetical protein